jgi:pimeloyl-ACP methyl ester carboxylesterase
VHSADLTSRARARGVRREVYIQDRKCVFYEYPPVSSSAHTVVMVHGYRGNHRGLEAIAGAMEDFRIVIPDLPGFGESESLDCEHNVAAYSNWLRLFLESQSISESSHLVGHSFGTLILAEYASHHQARSITLINPVSAPALNGPRSIMTKLATGFYKLAEGLPNEAAGKLLRAGASVQLMSSVMAKTKDRNLRRWIHQQHLSNFSDFESVRVATEGYRASISTSVSSYAKNITSPVLFIAAALDDITSIEQQRVAVQAFANAIIYEIEQVGHLVHYEAPQQAADQIAKFISDK